MTLKGYQYGFSEMHRDVYFDDDGRMKKAGKMIRIIKDALGENLEGRSALDIGCSTGVICKALSGHFGSVMGIDIDAGAIQQATSRFASPTISFEMADAMDTGLPSESFDVVICAHVYEHVPDPGRMLVEIDRVLKPGGICCFAAENKLVFREGDYGLPFLAILPKPLANVYLRLTRRGSSYYETLYTCWKLKKLVKGFTIIDFTKRVVEDPGRYGISDELPSGSIRQKLALAVLDHAYWLFPTYLWILEKPVTESV